MEQKATLVKFTDKKLGRGLSALLGESKVKSPLLGFENQDSVEKISLKKIRAGAYQPRQHFEETELQGETHIGFIAEDTREELATSAHDQMVVPSTLGILLKALQELDEKLQILENNS